MAKKKADPKLAEPEETEREAWLKRFNASLPKVDESGMYRDPIEETPEEEDAIE